MLGTSVLRGTLSSKDDGSMCFELKFYVDLSSREESSMCCELKFYVEL